MKLRHRLIAAMALFLVIGLAVADVVTYSAVRSFLLGRIDAQLFGSQRVAGRYLYHSSQVHRAPSAAALDDRIGPDVYVMVVAPDGRTLVSRPSGTPFSPDPAPMLPRALRLSSGYTQLNGPYHPNPADFDLSSASGVRYRVEATAVPQGTLLTAVPLTSTNDTLGSLLRTELVVSVAVIAALCVLALWTVRRGLRPLDDMASTAGAIASGDLTRRVATDDAGTEVGRLGAALNSMLAQIEAAFAQKSASESRLRQFVADASHELRTPLTSIRGYAELLRKGAFRSREEQERALARVEGEATRMGGLVDDLLFLARLDQGRPLERTPVDLRRVCEEAVDDARLGDPARPVTLDAPAPVVVSGDRDRLSQVAHNLVRNALVHTPPGTPVHVAVSSEGPMGVLRVADAGPGLPDGADARVFDRFYRADQSRTGQSTGLGLAIVRAIAEALDGRAWVHSRPGKGATFGVQVPLASAMVPVAAGPAAPASDPDPDPDPEARGRRTRRAVASSAAGVGPETPALPGSGPATPVVPASPDPASSGVGSLTTRSSDGPPAAAGAPVPAASRHPVPAPRGPATA